MLIGQAILFILIIAQTLTVATDNEARLSDVSVLLPFSEAVHYDIEAFNGCFVWQAVNPSLVSIEKIDGNENCCNKVRVRVRFISATRQSTRIDVIDGHNKKNLTCEIFFDEIKTVEIITTNRDIYKGKDERLDARGFDAAGNMFSSLEGLVFDWHIQPVKSSAAESILHIISFKDARVEASPVILSMEAKFQKSSAILVRALEIGTVEVVARLKDLTPKETSVLVSVREDLQLYPQEHFYLTTGTNLQYQLINRMQNKKEVISMPNSKYQWSITNTSVATINVDTGLVYTVSLGTATVLAEHVNMKENYASALLFVVEPKSLGLNIIPLGDEYDVHSRKPKDNWYLVLNRHYELNIVVYETVHRISQTDNLIFQVDVASDSIKTESTSPNQGSLRVLTLKEGVTTISIRLNQIFHKQELTIVKQVNVSPSEVVLAFDNTVSHTYTLKATGGSSPFRWYSSDVQKVSLLSDGVIRGDALGKTTIVCTDTNDETNFDKIEVSVVPPYSIAFLPSRVEAALGEILDLFVNVSTTIDGHFSNCSSLPFIWQVQDPNIFNLITSRPSHSSSPFCGSQSFKAIAEGTTTVHVKYERLAADITLVSYKPLKISHESLSLTLGSSFQIGINGGPVPWLLDSGGFSLEFYPSDPSAVSIVPNRYQASAGGSAWKIYTIRCLKFTQQNIIFKAGNSISENNPLPVTVNATLHFSCSRPHSLFIYPSSPKVQDNTCVEAMETCLINRGNTPVQTLPTEYRMRNNRVVEFHLRLFDAQDKSFHNFSSVHIEWSSSNTDFISLDTLSKETFYEESEMLPYQHTRTCNVAPKEGSASISVTANNYEKAALVGVSATDRVWKEQIFTFSLYPKIRIEPTQESVYSHQNNSIKLTQMGGSGHYITEVNGTASVEVIPQDNSRELLIKPVRLSEGIANVEVVDVCLPEDRVRSVLTISDIYHIKIASMDIVQVGKSIEMYILALDMNAIPFPVEQLRLMKFDIQVDNKGIVEVTPDARQPEKMRVTGLMLGSSSITLTMVTQKGTLVSSDPKQIHVFPPLVLDPLFLVLLPGAKYQLQWKGGPPVREEVFFKLTALDRTSETDIASVHNTTGLVTAHKLGSARIMATVYSYHQGDTRIELGSDSTELVVKLIDGIRIVSSTNRIIVGSDLVLQITGNNGENPFIFSNMLVQFKWEIGNSKVAQLQPIYKGAKISLDEESSFCVRVFAKSEGRTSITVTVTKAPPGANIESLSATYMLTVIEPLRLYSPSSILIAPGSHFQIRTNYDHDPLKTLRYESSLVNTVGGEREQIVSVSRTGLITASQTAGTVYIYISDSDLGMRSTAQSVILKVVVKPINGITLTPIPPVTFGLWVGNSQTFDIVVQDEMGSMFDSYDSVSFEYSLNVINIVSVTLIHGKNGTDTKDEGTGNEGDRSTSRSMLVVSGLAPGSIILKLQTKATVISSRSNDTLSTYLHIGVHNAISPAHTKIHIGGTVHFTTKFTSDTTYVKPWSCSDPSILSIDQETGIATALNLGKAVVSFSSDVSTQTTATVVRSNTLLLGPQTLHFEPSNQLVITIPVRIFTTDQSGTESTELLDSPYVNNSFVLHCEIEILGDQIELVVHPVILKDDYTKYCAITFSNDVNLLTGLKYPPMVKAIVSDKAETYKVEGSQTISFLPIFNVQPRFMRLSKEKSEEYVQVVWYRKDTSSENPVPVIETNESLLDVRKIHPGDAMWVGQVAKANTSTDFYIITVKSAIAPFEERVIFLYYETGQKLTIAVSYHPEGELGANDQTSSSGLWDVTFLNIVTGISAVVLTIVGVSLAHFCKSPVNQLPQTPTALRVPPGSTFTPPRGSPLVNGNFAGPSPYPKF